ncbi:MAG: tRNA (N6-threonylcarbamoyladenosine(37)-N6)-methyltransferase TrmO [Clostridia bacterium]|nr:tRNA (N6-threonylcarbamoyladenosine(37)-N6)-methyltransferase TrmO [Clostridia bacterium]
MSENHILHPIAYIHTDFKQKFGIPRQSGLVSELQAYIVFEPEFRRVEAVRGLEGFSHLWLIWEFSKTRVSEFRPTVRPPRLGGNTRVGVFASRAPYRPNGLGLSCVKLTGIDLDAPEAPVLTVSGADLLDGTPIYDIKPYIPVADCHPEASEGYTAETRTHRLQVVFPQELLDKVPTEKRSALKGVLACDPRPGYEDAPETVYGLSFAGMDVGFRVENGILTVTRVENE